MIPEYTSSQRLINHQSKPTKTQPTKTTTMSRAYTNATASYITKRQSREKVANGIMSRMNGNTIVHYLGGTSTQTPFENKFNGKDVKFIRYERLLSILPSGYKKVSFNEKGNPILPQDVDRGYFVNEDFFDSFFEIDQTINANQKHIWLDFCEMPKSDLLEKIYYSFLHSESVEFDSLYLTFFLNPRNCKEVKQLFKGEKTLNGRANKLIQKLQSMTEKNFEFEVFDTYNNKNSPMCVLKIERRENNDMSQKASVENYVKLHRKGFSNKQIAIFWRAGIMQVAGYAATAKRQKMI